MDIHTYMYKHCIYFYHYLSFHPSIYHSSYLFLSVLGVTGI